MRLLVIMRQGKQLNLPSDQVPGPHQKEQGNFSRKPQPPSAFAAKLAAKNEQLAELDIAELSHEEFCGARLYTGPMFMKYNIILRGLPDSAGAYLKHQLSYSRNSRITGFFSNSRTRGTLVLAHHPSG